MVRPHDGKVNARRRGGVTAPEALEPRSRNGYTTRTENWMCGWGPPRRDRFEVRLASQGVCGRSSGVERQLPKLNVVGSNPIARSNISHRCESPISLQARSLPKRHGRLDPVPRERPQQRSPSTLCGPHGEPVEIIAIASPPPAGRLVEAVTRIERGDAASDIGGLRRGASGDQHCFTRPDHRRIIGDPPGFAHDDEVATQRRPAGAAATRRGRQESMELRGRHAGMVRVERSARQAMEGDAHRFGAQRLLAQPDLSPRPKESP
jgi:hypothetical protein